jgi:hypothetical protein
MKKLFLFFAILVSFSAAFAQERTVNVTIPVNNTYYKYTAVAADVLVPTTTDTIDVVFAYQGSGYVKKMTIKSRFDMRTTADTTVAVSVFGKEFNDDGTYVQVIPSTVSSAVTSNNVVQVLASDYTETVGTYNAILQQVTTTNTDTIVFAAQTITPLDKSYRYYRVRYILSGNDSVGTGVKLDEIEIKFYTED